MPVSVGIEAGWPILRVVTAAIARRLPSAVKVHTLPSVLPLT